MMDDCCSRTSVFRRESDQSQDFGDLVVTDEQIKENIRIIELHRSFVYAIGKTIYPQYDFVAHDLSKFASAELIPYTIKFILKAPDTQNPGWTSALQHHYDNNPHHPQYWGDRSMPEEFLKESIVDMIAARHQYRTESEELPPHITADMLGLDEKYLTRYTETDRQRVKKELSRLRSVNWKAVPLLRPTFCQPTSTSQQ